MLTLPELKALAKQNKIHYSCMNKDDILKLLVDYIIIILPSDFTKSELVKRDADQSKYKHLKGIRNNPKTVEVFDKETGETNTFPSIYKTRRVLGISPVYIKDGTTWKNRYIIRVKSI